MVYFFIRIDNGLADSKSKLGRLQSYLMKNGIISQQTVFYGIEEYEILCDELVKQCDWIEGSSRPNDDGFQLQNNFNNCLKYDGWVVMLATLPEILGICNAYSIKTEFSSDFDAWILEWKDAWIEKIITFNESYDVSLDLKENVKNTTRALALSAFSNSESEAISQNIQNKSIITSITDKIGWMLRQIDSLENRPKVKSDVNTESLIEIQKDINRLKSKILDMNQNATELSTKLKFYKNEQQLNKDTIIKYATKFSRDQISLKEVQSKGNDMHEFTIINQTPYYWENLVIFFSDKPESSIHIDQLMPNQTIFLEKEYDFDLLQERGIFQIEVLYCNHPVSQIEWIVRVILQGLNFSGKLHNMKIKSNFIALNQCSLFYENKNTNVTKDVKINLTNFTQKEYPIMGLEVGVTYNFQLFKDNLALSLPTEFTA